MTCVEGFPTVSHMFTEAQILYLEEVLGTSTDAFSTSESDVHQALAPALAVVAETSSPDEKALLSRILGSVELPSHIGCEKLEMVPEGVQHLLIFGQGDQGRRQDGEQIRWEFPSLKSMLGNGSEVSNAKRRAWELLQRLQKELG